VAGSVAERGDRVLYVSGEESAGQIKIRAERLGANYDTLYLLPEINLETTLEEISKNGYSLIVIDSIQTLYSSESPSAPGSVTQVKNVTFELMRVARV